MPQKQPNDPEAERLARNAITCVPSRVSVIGRQQPNGATDIRTVLCFAIGDEFETILALDYQGVEYLADQLNRCLRVMKEQADAHDPLRN